MTATSLLQVDAPESLNHLLATATVTFDGRKRTAYLLGPLQLLSSTTHILIISTSQMIIDSILPSITPGEFEFCFLRTCHAPKGLTTVLLCLGPGLTVSLPFLNHSGPQNGLQLYLQTILFNKVKIRKGIRHSSLP